MLAARIHYYLNVKYNGDIICQTVIEYYCNWILLLIKVSPQIKSISVLLAKFFYKLPDHVFIKLYECIKHINKKNLVISLIYNVI